MRRKLQVFVSSTYEDLREERQAAVEAILKAGHIPAGMELFTAGSQSQFEVIKQWIDDSDVFMLILGARYGSIEPSTGLSYVELEFNYARDRGKEFFLVVLSDAGRETKVKVRGKAVTEEANVAAFQRFKAIVTSHLCAFFSTPIEVKVAVLEALPQINAKLDGVGWIAASDAQPPKEILKELTALSDENRRLRGQLTAAANAVTKDVTYEDIYNALLEHRVTIPALVTGGKDVETSLLRAALALANELARGVSNAFGTSKSDAWIMYNIASPLASWGLTEHAKVPNNVAYQRLHLSKAGVAFLSRARVQLRTRKALSASTAPPTSPLPSASPTGQGRKRKGKRAARQRPPSQEGGATQ